MQNLLVELALDISYETLTARQLLWRRSRPTVTLNAVPESARAAAWPTAAQAAIMTGSGGLGGSFGVRAPAGGEARIPAHRQDAPAEGRGFPFSLPPANRWRVCSVGIEPILQYAADLNPKPSGKVPDTHSIGSISDHDLGVFTVTNIATENTDAVPPAHPVPGTPKAHTPNEACGCW